MEKDKWVKTFLEMDIDKEPQYPIKVFKGNIITDGNFVQNNDAGLLVDLYNLKTKIGDLGDSAQLHYLNALTNLKPEMPFFSNESAHKKMAQAFFQNQIDYYEFIESYKKYLIEKIEAINPISKSIKEQSKSGIEILDYLGYNSNIETMQNYNTRKDNQSFSSFQKRITELMEQFRMKTPLTKQEADSLNNPEIKEGYLMERNPNIPQNEEEAFELFKNYYAAIQCELQKHLFETNYKVWNKASIEAELKEIEDWIKKADKISYKDAVVGTNNVILNQQEGLYEYLRLKNGFYKGYLMTWEQHNNSSISAMVYGRYFLFYEFLKEQIKKLITQPIETKQKHDRVMDNSLSFFEDMVHQLYTYNYKIGAVNFFNYESFIEAKHGQIEFKGKVFYQNLIHAMPITGERLADETKGEMPTYKEKIFKDVLGYCSKKMSEIENKILPTRLFETNEKQNEEEIKIVTTFDKLSRELDIIESIFKAQYQKYDETNPLPYPTILDDKGKGGIDGRYIASIDIFSNVELFNLQSYKVEFTKRFEESHNTTLLTNQLLELLEKAIIIRDYYNDNLTNKNEIVKEFLSKSQKISNELFENTEQHGVIINVCNYFIMEIYFGCSRRNGNLSTRNYEFNYISNNKFLASICQSIIEFINRFNLKIEPNRLDYEQNKGILDPLSFLDPIMLNIFLGAEKKALNDSGKFHSTVRCAAFCEILYNKKYIINTKTKQKTMNVFAKSRYGIDIKIALSTTKSTSRERHKNKTVNNMPPLNHCF